MDDIDFRDVEEVILVIDGEYLSFQNPRSFPEVGERLLELAPRKKAAPKKPAPRKRPPRRRTEVAEEPEDEEDEPEDEEDEPEDEPEEEAPPPKRKAKAKSKSKKSITHVPGGKSKMNLTIKIPSGNIKDAAEKLKAQARASSKSGMYKD